MKVVIFGASGDLAKRKLFPDLSLVDLKDTMIIAYARSNIKDTFQKKISEYGTYTKEFFNKIEYVQGSYDDIVLNKDGSTDYNDDYIFYLSVPPNTYLTLLEGLKKFNNCKIAIEKPFATDLCNYKIISQSKHLFFIDHYLLKPIVICMPIIRKKIVFKHFYGIDFIMKEELGIEGRDYFDAAGIVKDMMQNHHMILYTSLLCCNDRASVLKNTKITEYLLGQYNGYEDELGRKSKTETYALIFIKNKQYEDAIFTFQVGKGLDEKRTQIRIKYIQEYYKQIIEETLVDYRIYNDMKLDTVKKVELVIDVAKNCVYLEVEMDETRVFNLFVKNQIKEHSCEVSGKFGDHALIFDSLINNKEFSTTTAEEGMLQWELFEGLKKDIIYYEKGVGMPIEANELFEAIEQEYKK